MLINHAYILTWYHGEKSVRKPKNYSDIMYQIHMHRLSKHFTCKIVIIFLSINFNICFGSSKEPSH